MYPTRRSFIHTATIAGTVTLLAASLTNTQAAESPRVYKRENDRCPYFDQPLMCSGPDKNGKYTCDD